MNIKESKESGVALKGLLGDKKRSYNFGQIDILQDNRPYSRAEGKADVSGRFSRNIPLALPVTAAPMNDVCDAHVAIVAASNGALGVIPATYSPEAQAEMLREVKRAEGTFIENPFTLGPEATIAEALKARYSNIPIVHNGKFIGMYTTPYIPHAKPEWLFEGHMDKPVRLVMDTELSRITVFPEDVMSGGQLDFNRAVQIMRERIIPPALAIVSRDMKLLYLVAMKDVISKQQRYPFATRDKKNRLCVGAAILEHMTTENKKRIRLLADAEVDVIVIEQAQAWNEDAKRMTRYLKKEYPHIDVVVGNDSVGAAVSFHHKNGADGVKVGQGPGSECISGDVVGLWRPQFSTAYDCGTAAGKCGIPCTVDGGIKNAYHAFKALAAGGTAVMLGRLIAQTTDSPAEEIEPGKKLYRAMGSPELVKAHSEAFHKYDPRTFIPEGRSDPVDITVPLEEFLKNFKANLERCFERFGVANLEDLHTRLRNGKLRAQLGHNRETR